MARELTLIDSSFLYAALSKNNPKHHLTKPALATRDAIFRVPYVVLTETAFLFNRDGGVPSVLKFLEALDTFDVEFEGVSKADLRRAREVVAFYPKARLDFVDCCIVAIAERLNITRICTFDRRDFSIIRPAHSEAFELIP